jgi:hypothetical protein
MPQFLESLFIIGRQVQKLIANRPLLAVNEIRTRSRTARCGVITCLTEGQHIN